MKAASYRISRRFTEPRRYLWVIPVGVFLLAWVLLPPLFDIPDYKAPSPGSVWNALVDLARTGTLGDAIAASVGRLLVAAAIGTVAGALVGLAMATSPVVMRYVEPLATFFQAIAGIAWIPVAILWFGLGTGPVIFVVSNAVFFIVLYNTLLGVQRIPRQLYNAAKVLGANRRQILVEVSIPGAMVSVLAGTKSGLAFGWRALIGAELIVAGSGIGFISMQGARDFRGDAVIACIPVIGLIWLMMDRLLTIVENRTVRRWGMLRELGSN
jgi:ABC-type nitrate/sulfonate/bicarbonate transport system permease component